MTFSSDYIVESARSAAKAVKANSTLVIVGALWWGSYYLIHWHRGIGVLGNDRARFGVDWLVIASGLVVFALLALLARRGREFWTEKWPYVVGISFLLVGLVLFAPFIHLGAASPAVSALFLGITNGLGYSLLGKLHIDTDRASIPLLCSLEVAGGVAVYFALVWLPLPFLLQASAVIGTCSYAVIYRLAHRKTNGLGTSSEEETPLAAVDATRLQVLSLAFFVGLTDSITRSYTAHRNVTWPTAPPFEAYGSLLAIVLILLIYLSQRKRTALEQFFVFVIPLVTAGILLNPLFSTDSYLPIMIHHAGFVCLLMLLWYYAAAFKNTKGANHSVTTMLLLLPLSLWGGVLIGALLPVGIMAPLSVALIYAFLLLLAVVFVLQRRRIRTEEISSGDSQLAAFSDSISLTHREREVLRLLAQRRPYKQIEEELHISENTVKTHIKNIYGKAHVASREELLSRIDSL
ncbi:MAG: response regulator transcription factor [Coriobacteriia bacterium]